MPKFYSETLISNIHVHHDRWGYRNAPPFKPSAYRRTFSTATNADARTVNAEVEVLAADSLLDVNVTNKLHARFVAKLGDSSSFGATLTAESRETFSMISRTVLRCFRAARYIKRMDLASAARELGLPYREYTRTRTRGVGSKMVRGRKRPARYIRSRQRVFVLPDGRTVAKTAANGWLFWSYGVKPLAEDIYNGLDVLQRPLAYEEKIRVTASGSGKKTEVVPETWREYGTTTKWTGSVRGACGATVSVSNPNHYLLNKMGLANPFQWVLEGITFSFVLDWFSNLSQVVGQFNQFYGYDIKDTWRSMKYKSSRTWFSTSPYSDPQERNGFVIRRYTELPKPKLVFAYERFELQRALNAISLLIGFVRTRHNTEK